MTTRLLIIGNGMAGVRLTELLVKRAPGRFAITIVGAESEIGYNRVLLSALLAADIGRAGIDLRTADWYAAHNVRLITGNAVIAVDTARKSAVLACGLVVDFDVCVFATGSDPVRPPIPGIDLPGVMTFRDLADVATMGSAAANRDGVVVIGGGLLGIEAACGLAKRGADVTLVHVMDRLMERQLDPAAAALLKRRIEAKGIKVRLSCQTSKITGDPNVDGLLFADNSRLATRLVVCAVGVRPNATLAKSAGLAVNRGILVDDAMATSIAGFHAIGDCAEHRSITYGLVEPAYAQAEILAARLCGGTDGFAGMVLATNLKVSGVPVFSGGDVLGQPGTSSAVLDDKCAGTYRKLVFEGSRLVGCVLVGEADDALWYLDLIRNRTDITAARRDLLHGRQFAEQHLMKAA